MLKYIVGILLVMFLWLGSGVCPFCGWPGWVRIGPTGPYYQCSNGHVWR